MISHLMYFCIVIVGVAASLRAARADGPWSEDPPEALRRMAAAREALQTGIVEIAETIDCDSEYEAFRHRFNYITLQFAGADRLQVIRGDKDGVVRRNTGGKPAQHGYDLMFALKRGDKRLWTHRESAIEAELLEQGAAVAAPDARTLGLLPGFTYRGVTDALWRDPVRQPSARRYQHRREQGLDVVTMESDVGRITWWIDAHRGYNPVRVTLEKDGKLIAESRSTLKKLDGTWFPEKVEYYLWNYRDGREPTRVIETLSAEFNRPDHPSQLMPEDIGIVPDYTTIVLRDRHYAVVGYGVYSAEKGDVVTIQDGKTTPQEAELLRSEDRRAKGIRIRKPKPGIEKIFETEWEAYTRRFIERYRLDKHQTQKAWTICHNCQEAAQRYVRRNADRFERLEKKAAELRPPNDPLRRRALRQVEGELQQLRAPIDRIFEQQLKPRLRQLLTRKQREMDRSTEKQAKASGKEAVSTPQAMCRVLTD